MDLQRDDLACGPQKEPRFENQHDTGNRQLGYVDVTVARFLAYKFGPERRKERGFTQEQVAFESGYHPTYIGQLERGQKSPSLRAILGLARVLKLQGAELIRRVEALLAEKPLG